MQFTRIRSQPLVWILLVAVLLAIVLSFLSPFFMTVGNMTNLSKQVSIVAILAAGQAVVIISGGIAAYKSLEFIRRLKDRGCQVRCILTEGGAQFVTPLSVAALSGEKAYTDLFSLTDEAEMGHIRLSREADLVVVAPASADILAKMAGGLAADLATTALLATDKPVMVAPAMNVEMWAHPATPKTTRSPGSRSRRDPTARAGSTNSAG